MTQQSPIPVVPPARKRQSRRTLFRRVAYAVAGGLMLLWAALALVRYDEGLPDIHLSGPRDAPSFIFYTSPSVTTPQFPFWVAQSKGWAPPARWRVRSWKNLEDLQTLILAGKGDAWLGHIEGFARARKAGAPVVILAVTGWRKFYLVARPEAAHRTRLADWAGQDLPYTPPGTPGVLIAEALLKAAGLSARLSAHEPRQLAGLLARGAVQGALVPEPLVSLLCAHVEGLTVVGSLEKEYGAWSGYPDRLPLAGIAVHQSALKKYPQFIQDWTTAMAKAAKEAAADPISALETLPKEFSTWMPTAIVRASLDREVIMYEPASTVREEIEAYLRHVAPDTLAPGLLDDLLWSGE